MRETTELAGTIKRAIQPLVRTSARSSKEIRGRCPEFGNNPFIKLDSARLMSWERRQSPLDLAATVHEWRDQRHSRQWYAGREWSEKAGRRSRGPQAPVHLPVGRGKTVEPVRQAGEDNVSFVTKAKLFHHALGGDIEWQGPARDLR
jgi:hypothetical protein